MAMGIDPSAMCLVANLLLHFSKASEVGVLPPTVIHYEIPYEGSPNMIERERLEDLPAYVELKEDPTNLLPPAFTICSDAMSENGDIVFFTLLGNDGNQVLSTLFYNGDARKNFQSNSVPLVIFSESRLETAPTDLGLLFPQRWVRSCLALSTESGLLQWVAEGQVLVNKTVEALTEDSVLPQGMAARLLLGPLQFGNKWYISSGKISNLNVFSSALSIKAMKEITSDVFGRQGDYLAWDNMEWNLHGQASKQSGIKRLRHNEPNVLLFHTKFPSVFSCMEFCQKLGTRAPAVVTVKERLNLESFLKQELVDTFLNNSLEIWMSVKKRDKKWVDFYNNQLILNNNFLRKIYMATKNHFLFSNILMFY